MWAAASDCHSGVVFCPQEETVNYLIKKSAGRTLCHTPAAGFAAKLYRDPSWVTHAYVGRYPCQDTFKKHHEGGEMSSTRRVQPLRVCTVVGKRVPRKTALRTLQELCISAIILICLVILFRYHQATTETSSKAGRWPAINPRYNVDELDTIPSNIYYLTKEDVMYCYIPKNACSRFKPLLRKHEGYGDWTDPKMVHGKNGLQRLMWIPRSRALDRLRDPNFKKFVVVRDPFSRLISGYQNKVARPWPDQRADFWKKHLYKECPEMIQSMEMPKEGALLTLEDFLKCLSSHDSLEVSNEHWRPQSELCGLDYITYDRYLHVESLFTDVVDLLNMLQWHENATAFQMYRNPVYSDDLGSYFTSESLKLALEYYAEDFKVLGYPREPSGKIEFYSVFDGTNYQPGFVPPANFQPATSGKTN